MKRLIKVIPVIVLFAAPAFGDECTYPERPSLPDGNTASKDEMIAAQTNVKAFLANVESYLTCIEDEHNATVAEEELDEETRLRREDLLAKRFDAANEEKFLLGEQWNQQVRAYNAKKSGQSSD